MRCFLVVLSFFCMCAAFADESITITTYYPSPQGVYKTLKAKRVAIGSSYFQQDWVTPGGGVIPDDVNLTVEGKVGVGTLAPAAQLELGDNQWILLNPKQAQTGINFYETGTKSETDVQYGSKIFYQGTSDVFKIVTRENNADKLGIAIKRVSGDVGIGTDTPQAKLQVSGGTIRGEFSCRVVTSGWTEDAATANCASDEFVMTGGGQVNYGSPHNSKGFLHESMPLSDLSGWTVNCYDHDWTGADAYCRAKAVCCKK